VHKLLEVLHRLVDAGNSVVVIEHNLDVIKTADWIVDLGPEGGPDGGRVIAEGTPEAVAATPASFTGHYLKKILDKAPRRAPSAAQAARAPSAVQAAKAKSPRALDGKAPTPPRTKAPAAKKTAGKAVAVPRAAAKKALRGAKGSPGRKVA
jgi:excinuclease ABC subunit A